VNGFAHALPSTVGFLVTGPKATGTIDHGPPKLRAKYTFHHIFLLSFLFLCFFSDYVTQAALELTNLFPQPPKCWD
jgi:hypothetical protein